MVEEKEVKVNLTPSEKKEWWRDALHLAILYIFFALFTGVIPVYLGTAGEAFTIRIFFDKFLFQPLLGILGLVMITTPLKIGEHTFWKGKVLPIVHDPERNKLFYQLSWFRSQWKLALLFLLLTLVWAFTNRLIGFEEILGATPVIEEQFTKSTEVLFKVFPASVSETIFMIGLISLFQSLIFWKFGKSKGWFWFFMVLGVVIFTILGLIYHDLAYSEEKDRRAVGFFWAAGYILTVVFQSWIPFTMYHITNNLAVAVKEVYKTNETLAIWFVLSGIVLILAIVLTIVIERALRKARVRRER